MPTTAGSWAFADAKAKQASAIVQNLIDSGLIILGKANMTVSKKIPDGCDEESLTTCDKEFAGMKMMTSPGRSAFGGQTRSPYVQNIEQDQPILGHSVRSRSLHSVV